LGGREKNEGRRVIKRDIYSAALEREEKQEETAA
jgi:hypothetical protein